MRALEKASEPVMVSLGQNQLLGLPTTPLLRAHELCIIICVRVMEVCMALRVFLSNESCSFCVKMTRSFLALFSDLLIASFIFLGAQWLVLLINNRE